MDRPLERRLPHDEEARWREAARTATALAIQSATLYGADMPVGAVALSGRDIIGMGFANDQRLDNPDLHAEIEAVFDGLDNRSAGQSIDTIVSTMEPCVRCQDTLAGVQGVRRLAYVLPRTEASNRGLVRYHEESARERATRLKLPFEVVQINDETLAHYGRAILDAVARDQETGNTIIAAPTMWISLAKLRFNGHIL